MNTNTNTIESNEVEVWKDVTLFHGNLSAGGYQVSNLGRVRKYRKAKRDWKNIAVFKTATSPSFRVYELNTNKTISRLVCEAFNGKPSNDDTVKYDAVHKDGDVSNNRADNLYWMSRSEHRYDQMLANRYPINVHVTVTDTLTGEEHQFNTINSAAKFLGVINSYIFSMVKSYKDIPYNNRYHVNISSPERLFAIRRFDNRTVVFLNHYTGEVGEAFCLSLASYMTGVRTRDISNRCRFDKTFSLLNGYEFHFVEDKRPWSVFSDEEIVKSKQTYELRLYGKILTVA